MVEKWYFSILINKLYLKHKIDEKVKMLTIWYFCYHWSKNIKKNEIYLNIPLYK